MRARAAGKGFTLIELLVVLAIIGTLITIALPKYQHSVQRSREAVLHQDLHVMRTAIDQYVADTGRFPDTLDELVRRRYLRSLPEDPVTGSAGSWISIAPPEGVAVAGVYDVRSGADGLSLDGTAYAQW